MNSYSSGRRSRRSRGGVRRRDNHERFRGQQGKAKPQKMTFWQRVVAFFGDGTGIKKTAAAARNGAQPSRPPRKPETVQVTSPRLYVGNLSFDATESDLFELFNGVGHVQNAEVVSYRHNQRSKGSETGGAGITRQRIPRPQTGRERRKIQRASNAKLTGLLTSIGRRGAAGRASPDFVWNK
jgi:hypothetical protein